MPIAETLKWAVRISGAVLALATAVLIATRPNQWLWIVAPVLFVWAGWLVVDYLQWARTLGRGNDNNTSDHARDVPPG